MSYESFDDIKFDLGPLLQGQMGSFGLVLVCWSIISPVDTFLHLGRDAGRGLVSFEFQFS